MATPKYVYSYSFGKEIFSFPANSLTEVLDEFLDIFVDNETIKNLSFVPDEENNAVDIRFDRGEDEIEVKLPLDAELICEFAYCINNDEQYEYYFTILEL